MFTSTKMRRTKLLAALLLAVTVGVLQEAQGKVAWVKGDVEEQRVCSQLGGLLAGWLKAVC
jgi:hypothetical protein